MRKLTAVAGIVLLVGCGGTAKESSNPGVQPLDPAGEHSGRTYSGWASLQWSLAYSLPKSQIPLFDKTGDLCQNAQPPCSAIQENESGGRTDRRCSVPSGNPLFFPIHAWQSDNLGVPKAQRLTHEQNAAEVERLVHLVHPDQVFLTLDGEAMKLDFSAFFVPATNFAYTASAVEPIFDPTSDQSLQVDDAVTSGYYVMLPALSTGRHTLGYGVNKGPDTDFSSDIEYILEVQ